MKTETYKSMGLEWPLEVPSTVEEFDKMAQAEGACLANSIDHIVFHDTLGNIRSVFTEELDKFLKAPERAADRVANGFPETAVEISWNKKNEAGEDIKKDGEVVELNEGEWFNRVKAQFEIKDEAVASRFGFLVPAVLANPKCRFDPHVKPRQPGAPKKLSKESLNSADQLLFLHGKNEVDGKKLANPVDVIGLVEKLIALNKDAKEAQNVERQPNGLPTRDALARLISVNEARKRSERKLSNVVLADVGAL